MHQNKFFLGSGNLTNIIKSPCSAMLCCCLYLVVSSNGELFFFHHHSFKVATLITMKQEDLFRLLVPEKKPKNYLGKQLTVLKIN